MDICYVVVTVVLARMHKITGIGFLSELGY